MLAINKRLALLFGVVIVILAIPLIAMQFTSEVNWDLTDFIAAGIILFGAVIVTEVFLRIFKKQHHRKLIVAAILVITLLLWAELAVGIFGSPLAGS